MEADSGDSPDYVAEAAVRDSDDGDDDEDDGRDDEPELEWPLALRILPPALETGPLREHVTRLVTEAERQAEDGKVEPRLVKELSDDVGRLQRLLAERAYALPVSQTAIEDARRFLSHLQEFATAPR